MGESFRKHENALSPKNGESAGESVFHNLNDIAALEGVRGDGRTGG